MFLTMDALYQLSYRGICFAASRSDPVSRGRAKWDTSVPGLGPIR
ncbi:MAG: hypothetical protein DIJKHBIC_04390 [Thermoanaerobaculia bacterium]|nr:hypothetical protein [Thermoanaerobaculia bacterium]